VTDEQRPERLPRVLGPWMAIAIVVGIVIGSGIFKKPHQVAVNVPEIGFALSGWILVGILTIIGALVIAELATLYPRAGGVYVYLREGLGRWAGFLWGWVEFWVIRSASISALAAVFVESLHDVVRRTRGMQSNERAFTEETLIAMTVVVISTLALINARGTRLGGMLQVAITSVKMGSLLAIALAPFVLAGLWSEDIVHADVMNAAIWPDDVTLSSASKFGTALVGILFAYHGWTGLAPVAEDIRSPGRNIPIAFILGVLCVMLLYVSANVAYFLVLPVDTMQSLTDRTVVAAFAERLFGPIGSLLASAAVMMSVFGALNANMLVGPRLLVAMGRDRLVPSVLARLHPRYETPAIATLVLAGWSIVLIVGSSLLLQYKLPRFEIGTWTIDLNLKTTLYDLLSDYAMFGAVAFETLGVAMIYVFRSRGIRPMEPNAYRAPLYPLLPAIYIVAMLAVLANMFVTMPVQSTVGVAFVGLGAIVYLLFGRQAGPVEAPSTAIFDRDR
jgi:basic amino acid/polyamine antiporter, APA family